MKRVRNITTMAEMQAALQAAFNAINEYYYNNELEKVVITVKEGRKAGVLGTFCTAKEWVQNGKKRHEINIAANYIGSRTVEETIVTLMHEMAHLYNNQNNIKDVSRSGTYHNKKFKETAELHGLIIECMPKIGWSATKPTPQTSQWIAENIPIKSFKIYKTQQEPTESKTKKKSSMVKKVCPCCGNIARVTKEYTLICGDCNKEMEVES